MPAPSTSTVARGSAVGRRRATDAARPHLVVVGNGMVGWKFCSALVERGLNERWYVTVCGEESRPAYDRVNLTRYFSGRSADDLLLAPREWYATHQLALHTGDPVVVIDRTAREVTTRSGQRFGFDHLVLATGSQAFVPPLPGRELPGVFVYRTIEDLERIRTRAHQSRTAAVIGGGLLGLEAAQALRDLGVAPTVLERGPHLMARQLSPAAAELLRVKVDALGVQVAVNRTTEAIRANLDGRLTLHFRDGEDLVTDLLIIAAGIRPRQELAEACGLPCDRRGGVIVNDELTTADRAVSAIGECAAHRGETYGLAAPGFLMAETLADRLLGRRRFFRGVPLSARLKLLGVEVAALGEFQEAGETLTHRTTDTHRELIFRRGRLVGAITVGPDPEIIRLQDAVERRRFMFPHQRSRFGRTGSLWKPANVSDPSHWPAATIVCNCTATTRGALSAACAGGCRSVEALAQQTGASTVCGSCRPLLAQLVGTSEATRPLAGRKTLLGICGGAMAALVVIALVPAIPAGASIEFRHFWHTLFVEPFWRQVTGFTVLGLAVLSLLFSLRKRIRRLAWGDVAWWRMLHTSLGLLGAVGLVAHTGLRLGSNFNRLLMLDFLALMLLGTLAGSVIALETRLDVYTARRLRTAWTWAHIILTWPLPVLLGFHVFAAYYF